MMWVGVWESGGSRSGRGGQGGGQGGGEEVDVGGGDGEAEQAGIGSTIWIKRVILE